MKRADLAGIIDQACWDARRRWGHDDNGLDGAVDIDGNPAPDPYGAYHPATIEALAKIDKLNTPTTDTQEKPHG